MFVGQPTLRVDEAARRGRCVHVSSRGVPPRVRAAPAVTSSSGVSQHARPRTRPARAAARARCAIRRASRTRNRRECPVFAGRAAGSCERPSRDLVRRNCERDTAAESLAARTSKVSMSDSRVGSGRAPKARSASAAAACALARLDSSSPSQLRLDADVRLAGARLLGPLAFDSAAAIACWRASNSSTRCCSSRVLRGWPGALLRLAFSSFPRAEALSRSEQLVRVLEIAHLALEIGDAQPSCCWRSRRSSVAPDAHRVGSGLRVDRRREGALSVEPRGKNH